MGRLKASIASTAMLAILLIKATSYGKTDVPVFLLSGQSNMAGMQALVSDLTADQKKTVDSVMIHMDAEGDAAKRGKWLTLGPGFGSTSSNLGPELFFGRILSDSAPGKSKKIALIKDAVSGTTLGQAGGWLPPSSNNGTGGTLYKNMMTHIDKAMKSFTTAFDTSKFTPRWAGFVWLQGENDAMQQSTASTYETNLTNLIKDIRAKVEVPDLPVILPMIDVQSRWTYNSQVRAADVACKQKLKNVDTMDTKGLPTNGIHYMAQGHVKIGTICAQRWLNMNFTYGNGTVPIVYHNRQPEISMLYQVLPFSSGILFDVMGRKIGALDGKGLKSMLQQSGQNNGIFILQFNQHTKRGNLYSKKIAKVGKK
jgi:hypothetical protein